MRHEISILRKLNSVLKSTVKMSSSENPKKDKKPSVKSKSKPEKPEATNNSSNDDQPEASSSGMSIDKLQKYLAEKLTIKEKDKVKVLDSVSIDGIVDYIKQKNIKNIITLAGAGMSTSAGIPDFRSPGSGLYHNLQKYNLPHPQAIFELDFFHENPKPFFVLAKELYPGSFKPTISHYFIRLLIDKGVLLRHYTQNIDTLERVAGIPEEKIVEAHGTFYTGHCLKCRKQYSLVWMKERIFKDEIPKCEARSCEGVVKPDIVFFGEALPMKFYNLIETDFKQCDLLIILGSSLVVQPFASLVERVSETCPRLLINREKVGHKTGIMAFLGFGGGFEFDDEDNTRDVAWLGDCDEGCQILANKLGWGEELKKLYEDEIKKIEAKETFKEDSKSKGDEKVKSAKM